MPHDEEPFRIDDRLVRRDAVAKRADAIIDVYDFDDDDWRVKLDIEERRDTQRVDAPPALLCSCRARFGGLVVAARVRARALRRSRRGLAARDARRRARFSVSDLAQGSRSAGRDADHATMRK